MVVDGHTAYFTGKLDHVVRYGPQQMRFDPPASEAVMPMGWKAAFRACFTGPPCAATGDAIISLAVATGPPGYPQKNDPSEMTANFFQRRLVYVITWQPSRCLTGQAGVAKVCRVVDFVDGRSRAASFAIEIADSQPTVTS